MTKIVEFDARATMERQAREWLIRLDGDEALTSAETKALHDWLNRSPLHRQELTRLARFWQSANILTVLAVPLQAEQRQSPIVARVAMAACAVVASIILAVWWPQSPRADAINGAYATAIGQQQTIALTDGSSVQLNTDSEVRIEYSATLRRIRLQRGEALFTVARSPNKPFEVYAGQGRVRALGTSFAVELEHERGMTVTVTSGVVEVAEVGGADPASGSAAHSGSASTPPSTQSQSTVSPRTLARLQAGETMRIAAAAHDPVVQHLAAPELRRRIAWHEGYLVFNGEPLSEVVTQVNRYSPVTLQVDDPQLAALAIGGRFRIGDLDAVLDALHSNFGIQANRIDARSIRLEPVPQQ